jgi:hypothetical protein
VELTIDDRDDPLTAQVDRSEAEPLPSELHGAATTDVPVSGLEPLELPTRPGATGTKSIVEA